MQKVTVDGQVYEYDAGKLMISEAMEVWEKTRLTLRQWNGALEEMDPRAVKALIYLLKQRAGERPDWNTLEFDLGGLDISSDDDEGADVPKEPGSTSTFETSSLTETATSAT